MAHATHQDVAETLGRPITDQSEITQVEAWLRRVETRIKSRIRDLDTLAADGDYLQTLKDVEADIVARRVLNPEGKQSERIDDYSYGREDDWAAPDLWPTEAEWALLAPVPYALPVAYTVDLGTLL